MKYSFFIFSLLFVISCSRSKEVSVQEVKKSFGDFQGKTLKYLPADYHKAPIYQKISKNPDAYHYLDKIEIYSMAHISDNLFVTGFMVAPKAEGKYPCIIFNRGGNQEEGRLIMATAVELMAPLAAEGYVVIASNYRGNSGSEGKEEFGGEDIHDVLNLSKSLAEYNKADTSRIGLLGISRGGMMNLLALSKNKNTIKCIANIGGITDLKTTIEHHSEIEEVCKALIPTYLQQKELEIQKRSAVKWCHQLPKNTPILLLHSIEDNHVHYAQIPIFADSLQKHQIPYQLISFENDNHGIMNHDKEVKSILLNWFNTYLKQNTPFQEKTIRKVVK